MTNLSLKVWYLPHSTDLTTLVLHLWQYLNDILYHTKLATWKSYWKKLQCHVQPSQNTNCMAFVTHVQQIQHHPDVNREHLEHKS